MTKHKAAAKRSRPSKAPKPRAQKEGARAKKKEEAPRPVERTEEELVDLTSRVYKLVVERGREGVLQSEIWKELGLTSRDGSRLAIRLERRGLIGRVKVLEEGRWTYKLTPLRFPTDMTSIEKAPCIVCQFESKCSIDGQINPYICPWIGPWVIEEARVAQMQAPQADPVPAR
ncbi:MAG: transcriptional regulator [Thaumarchaeota archaeon]|nr:transcriptional regulator [Nitrososphaerota archaeon]